MASKQSRIFITVFILMLILLAGFLVTRDGLKGTRIGGLLGFSETLPGKTVYYCPMHPDYKSDKQGDCPICNMSLVKLEAEAGGEEKAASKDVYYCPMHPDYKSDRQGDCPICNMSLVKLEEKPSDGRVAGNRPPGSIKISSQKQQLIGVQYGDVSFQPLSKTVRTVGRLTYDETKIARIHTKVEGWIEQVYVDFTGELVKKNQPLISLYSPELLSTQQEFLIAKKAKDSLKDSDIVEVATHALSLYEASRERLRLWDISEGQIKELEARGSPIKTLTLYSPIGGFVLTRNAFEGQRITPETELYTIADVSTIWVLADIYEYELPMVRLGQAATMTLTYFPGKEYKGKVTYVYPQVDAATRTIKVRLEFLNPDYRLKPDMYANIELHIDYGKQIFVPQEAVLDSGNMQIVFVALEEGYFEPRRVRLGARVDTSYIILSGLTPGEKIVTSGNFLIDSESQLKAAMGLIEGMKDDGQKNPSGVLPEEHSGHVPVQ
jgi:RND family efflux transporter MFP subunit